MSFLSSVDIEVGTESNPMSSLSELDNSPSEFVTVFTDLGGQLSTPMEVEVLKGETGGPFMVVSFDFQGGGGGAHNANDNGQGAKGGSGIVLIRYEI